MSKENSKRYCIRDFGPSIEEGQFYPTFSLDSLENYYYSNPQLLCNWAYSPGHVKPFSSLDEAYKELERIKPFFLDDSAIDLGIVDIENPGVRLEYIPKEKTPINVGPGAVISDCNFNSNDKYTINFADSLVALAKAVEQNAKAIQDICRMVINSDKINNPFIRLEKNNENQ